MGQIFVRASRRARAYTRRQKRSSDLVMLKRLQHASSRAWSAANKGPKTWNRITQLATLTRKLDAKADAVKQRILHQRFNATKRGLTGFNVSKHRG